MTTTQGPSGTFASGGDGSPVVPQDPPPLIARAAGWIVLALFAAAAAAVSFVRLPEVVEVPFVLASAVGVPEGSAAPRARLTLAEHDVSRIRRGARARLFFDAYPAERHGTIEATLDTDAEVEGAAGSFAATATLDAAPSARDETRIVPRVGLRGRARIEVARRSLLARWFG